MNDITLHRLRQTQAPNATSVSGDNTLPIDLTSYWELEAESGERFDVNNLAENDLTDNNSVGFTASGIQGNAADFEQTNNEYLSITSGDQVDISGGEVFSISCWVKAESFSATYPVVFSQWDEGGANNNRVYALAIVAGKFYWYVSSGLAFDNLASTITPATATWYHIVCTYENKTNGIKMYINGSLENSRSPTNVTTVKVGSLANIRMGSADKFAGLTGTSIAWDGLIDEVGYWSKVLSATDVKKLYNSGSGIPYFPSIVDTNLTAWLDCGRGYSYPKTGSTWNDISGNSNDMTLTSSPTYDTADLGSLNFNGTSSYVSQSGYPATDEETIIVWGKSDTATWNVSGWLSSQRSGNGHVIHPTAGTKNVSFFLANSSGGFTNIGTETITDITIPHCYAYTTNGSNSHKVYVDGVEVATSTATITRGATPITGSWFSGKDDTGTRYGDGNTYVLMRYDRELTADEILQNYNSVNIRF